MSLTLTPDTLARLRELLPPRWRLRAQAGVAVIPRDARGRFIRRGQRCTVYLMPGGRCSLSHGHARRHRLT